MLNTEEKKLRWLGIDMRSRGRRRVAVVATYAAFLVAVWVHPRRTYAVELVLWFSWIIFEPLSSAMVKDALPVWAQRGMRVVVCLAPLAAVWLVWHARGAGADVAVVGMYASSLLVQGSVVGWGKLVEPSGRGWMGQAVREGEPLSWRKQRRLARRGFALGLDGFAWYEYGMRFKRLTEEQKLEIEQMRRANPRGKWMRNRETILFDDERMRQEDDRVRAQVQRVMSGILLVSSLAWYLAAANGGKVRMEIVVVWSWTVAMFAVTLRQAIVLWTEEDPRAVTDEIAMVQEQEV